jgi:hypothetical protein
MQFRSTTLLAVLLVAVPAFGFSPVVAPPRRAASSTPPTIVSSSSLAAGLTSSDGGTSNDKAPTIFDDAVLEDMQQALLTLELRVQQGPGSLTALQVEELDGQMQRIMNDMRANQHKKPVRPERTAEASTAPAAAPAAVAAPAAPVAASSNQPEHNDEDGAAYDGEGGMGLSRGTANTYHLEGMDEMSPEEYRDKLQKSVSDRQDARKKSGEYGNRQSWSYMSSLTGEVDGPLKRPKSKKNWKPKNRDDDDDDE